MFWQNTDREVMNEPAVGIFECKCDCPVVLFGDINALPIMTEGTFVGGILQKRECEYDIIGRQRLPVMPLDIFAQKNGVCFFILRKIIALRKMRHGNAGCIISK